MENYRHTNQWFLLLDNSFHNSPCFIAGDLNLTLLLEKTVTVFCYNVLNNTLSL